MTRIKFENREFRVRNAEFAICDNKPIDIIIYADLDTLESIAEFAKGPYNIQEVDGVTSALYSHLAPFEVCNVEYFFSGFLRLSRV